MFIPKKIYKMLVKSRDEWKDLAERIQADNKRINKTAEETLELAKSINNSNKELINHLRDARKEVAKEIIADIEKILEVDANGEAKFDITELFKIEKKYTEGGE